MMEKIIISKLKINHLKINIKIILSMWKLTPGYLVRWRKKAIELTTMVS
jgi:hypothetical protein